MKKIFFIFVYLALLAGTAYAQEEPRIPSYQGYVNDFAGVIGQEDKNIIEALARELDEKTTAQLAVVTISTTGPSAIEQYAVELFEKWGIGRKNKDNGLLILMAVNDRTVRIETGYGLEGAVPDAIANQVINEVMIPQFKQGKLSFGLALGAASVAKLIAKEYNITLSTIGENAQKLEASADTHSAKEQVIRFLALLAFWIILGIIINYYNKKHGKKGRMWYAGGGYYGRGGFGGGFGGFGGGFSGGGGATGRW